MNTSSVCYIFVLIYCIIFNISFNALDVRGERIEKDSCSLNLIAGNGSFSLPSENNCEIYIYMLDCPRKSSIISFTSRLYDSNDTLDVPETTQTSASRSVSVVFTEYTILKDGTKPPIIMNQWNLTSQNISTENIYFSRTSRLHIAITVTGNWSENALKFFYEEVKYEGYQHSSKIASGVITPWVSIKGRDYRPNSVCLFQINKSDGMTVNSIDIVLNYLDIDDGIGEYILIGSGNNPFEGPPPLFISSLPYKKKYKINDENAYIVFVSTATRTRRKGFQIEWKHNGTKISIEKDISGNSRSDDVLQSSQICIYNMSAALSEFNKSDPFKEFREKLAVIGSRYAKENYLISEYANISSLQVHIYRVSGIIPKDETIEDLKEGGLYAMVKIQGSKKGTAAFRWDQLEDIINIYNKHNESEKANAFKVGSCPQKSFRNKWISIGLYAIIPILCCIFFFVWAWKHSPYSEILSKKLKMAAIRLRPAQRATAVPVEENVYTNTTLPKVRIINDQGRRYTLNFEEIVSSCADEDSDIEVFNKSDFKGGFRRHSNIHESRSERSSGRRSSKRPEINEAFIGDEECDNTLQPNPQALDTQSHETEHVYDSVKSAKSLSKGNITAETRL